MSPIVPPKPTRACDGQMSATSTKLARQRWPFDKHSKMAAANLDQTWRNIDQTEVGGRRVKIKPKVLGHVPE